MAFKVQTINADLMNGTANVVALDQSTQPQVKVINVQFPFTPPGHEGQEKDKVVVAAKLVLQQALNEI
jgi:hypothetical protein